MPKFAKALGAIFLASLVCVGASLAQTTARWSTEDSTIGDMLNNPRAKAIFQKYFPEFINDPRWAQASERTLPEIRQAAPAVITREKLAAMDAELAALTPRVIAVAPAVRLP